MSDPIAESAACVANGPPPENGARSQTPGCLCSVQVTRIGDARDHNQQKFREDITLEAITGAPENGWTTWDPAAVFSLHVTDRAFWDRFAVGQEFYVTLIPVNRTPDPSVTETPPADDVPPAADHVPTPAETPETAVA